MFDQLLTDSSRVYELFATWYQSIMDSAHTETYIIIAIGVGVLFLFFLIIIPLFLKSLHKLAMKTKNDFDEVVVEIVRRAKWPIFFIIILYMFSYLPQVAGGWETGLKVFLQLIVTYQVILAVNRVIEYAFGKVSKKRAETGAGGLAPVFVSIIKGAVWIIGALMIMTNLGYEITPLITGLGIGGIAIALALQNILSDLFSSFSIYLDKPFKVGDFIVVDKQMGTVKSIGIKTTRITSLSGEELVMPNKKLVESSIQNYKKMKERRVEFHVGVTYETKPAKLKAIPGIIKDSFKGVKNARFDRAHFESFGDFSLNFEIVYYVSSGDYREYMDIQEKVNLNLATAFNKSRIEFAYPTQKVFVSK